MCFFFPILIQMQHRTNQVVCRPYQEEEDVIVILTVGVVHAEGSINVANVMIIQLLEGVIEEVS